MSVRSPEADGLIVGHAWLELSSHRVVPLGVPVELGDALDMGLRLSCC